MKNIVKIFVNTLKPAELYTHTHTHTHTGKPCKVKFFQFVFISVISLFSINAFATGITATDGSANPATCDTGTLGSDTGPVDLRAEFTPENINLKWYNGDTRINVANASNSCTYDTAISLPPNPTRPGYKFKGWKVVFDLSALDSSVDGTSYGYISDDGNNIYNTNLYNLVENGTWGVTFSYGKISGKTLCSDTFSSTWGTTGIPSESNSGANCWCRVIKYYPNNTETIYSPMVSPYVFVGNRDTLGYCMQTCAQRCSDVTYSYASIRVALFGQSGS